jgi:membrane fusion protein (multidrug efflux system)
MRQVFRLGPLVPFVLLLAAAAPPPAAPPAVGVVPVTPQQITQSDEFVGRIEAENKVAIVARVTAFIDQELFTQGGEVTRGQKLFVLERAPFEADVEQRAGAVAQVQATIANDQIRFNRAKALLNTPAGQRSTLDDAKAQLLADQAQLMQNQALLRSANINLAYTDIIAPIDGKIGRALITPGNVVSPSSGTLATIVSQDPMYVTFPVSRETGAQLRNRYATHGGLAAVRLRVRLQDGSMYDKIGKLVFVDNTVSQNTDTILFRGEIANPVRNGLPAGAPGSRFLIDGQFVTVLLQGVVPVSALAVPRAAVLSDQQGDYVFVVGADDVARRTPVQLGQSTPATAIIMSGLSAGQQVVLDGLQRVRDGAKVSPGPASPVVSGAQGSGAPE